MKLNLIGMFVCFVGCCFAFFAFINNIIIKDYNNAVFFFLLLCLNGALMFMNYTFYQYLKDEE